MPTTAAEPAEHVVEIDPAGNMRFVYSDDLAAFLQFGKAAVKRVSLVTWLANGWLSDLSPVGGPTLGPFASYAEAVAAEVKWLQANGTPLLCF